MRRMELAVGMLIGLLGSPAASAQAAPQVFAALEGRWEGEGTLFGGPAHFVMEWELVHGVAILTFANSVRDPAGGATPVLGAVAIYRTTTATPRATWEDTRGVQVSITWTATDTTLVSTWTAPTESGRTTYTLEADGSVTVVDEVMQPDGLVLFGQASYQRVK